MKNRKLMIMGAGIYQVPLINKAKEMGLETLVVSIEGNYPGIRLADKFFAVDTRDMEKVLEIAKSEGISGICTSGTDVAVKTIGYVNEQLGLSGIPYNSACCVTDKALMKEKFKMGHVSTAAFEKVCTLEEASKAANKIGYPVVVKIVDSSGSRGVAKVENDKNLEDTYITFSNITKKEYLLIEKYISAEEIGVDGYVGQDDIKIILPHKKFTCTVDGVTIPSGHSFPYNADERLIEELEKQITLAVKALGLKNCPFNADVFVRGDQVWIIEMGGRTGATCIPELISIYKGYNWYEKIILAALGETVDFAGSSCKPCIAKLLFSEKAGTIKSIDSSYIDTLIQRGVEICLDYKEGDFVDAVRNGTDRIGHIIATDTSEQEMDMYVNKMLNAVSI